MNTNMLAFARSLSNQNLLDRLAVLAGNERHASVELIAHLAALQERPSLYEGLGFGSLFDYCTGALRLSEDATCTRTAVAGACRRFPVIPGAPRHRRHQPDEHSPAGRETDTGKP